MKELLEPIRGFRDYTPPESEVLTWICNSFKEVAELFGYREVKAPTIENFKLFALKSGEEIRNSMYVFVDKGGREVALRPEVTPSVIRIYLRELKALPKPLRLFYIANVFRYDEPQYGRYREFTQAGVEVLGGDSIYYDVELIELLEEFYSRIGLDKRMYKVNNVALFRKLAVLADLSSEETEKLLHLLDKGLFDEAAKVFEAKGRQKYGDVVRLLALSRNYSNAIDKVESILRDAGVYQEVEGDIEDLVKYLDILKSMGVNAVLDPAFARGIAYYTGIIFEVQVPGMPISIAGGGRYDNLSVVYGGDELSSTGFAIGVERTMLALQYLGRDLRLLAYRPSLLFLLLDESIKRMDFVRDAIRKLRDKGLRLQVEITSPSRIGKWLEYASKSDFDYVIIVGLKEVEKRTAILRNLKKWSQVEVPIEKLGESVHEN